MYILITGAAGFIGFHTILKLLKKNYKVIGVDNINNFYDQKIKRDRVKILKSYSKKNFIFFKKDISNYKEIEKIFSKNKIKLVINLAAQAGVRYSLQNPKAYFNSNLLGFYNVINLCNEFKVKRLIYASTSSVYGNNKKIPFKEEHTADHPIQFYAATKRANELIAHSFSSVYNLETIGLRFFTVYGPWGRPDMALFKFVKNIIENKSIHVFNYGKHVRDFTYIDDIVDGILILVNSNKIFKKKIFTNKNFNPNVSDCKFKIFNIGSGKTTSLSKYINIIEKELKKKAKRNIYLYKKEIFKKLYQT